MLIEVDKDAAQYVDKRPGSRRHVSETPIQGDEDDRHDRRAQLVVRDPGVLHELLDSCEAVLAVERHRENFVGVPSHLTGAGFRLRKLRPVVPIAARYRTDREDLLEALWVGEFGGAPVPGLDEGVRRVGEAMPGGKKGNRECIEKLWLVGGLAGMGLSGVQPVANLPPAGRARRAST